jgi:hypothetical protein
MSNSFLDALYEGSRWLPPTRIQRIKRSESAAWIILRAGRSTLVADSIDEQLTCMWWL